jgi:DNA-binding transcriptional ArsR family regulator
LAEKNRIDRVELDQDLAQVISNDNTVKALGYLVEREGSPKEVGETLGISTSLAGHHIKKLEALRLVELIEERDVGGTIQHVYRAVIRPMISTEEWGKLSIAQRQRYSLWIVRILLADASRAFNTGTFDAHPNRHLSRIPMVVDAEGLDEVAEIQNRALREIIHAETRSTERRAQSGDPGMNLVTAMMCFEIPEPSAGPSGL